MIQLYARDLYAGYGIATALSIEGIAWRRIETLQDADGPLLVAASDLDRSETEFLAERRSLVITGGEVFAQHAFADPRLRIRKGLCRLSLSQALWRPSVRETAARFGIEELTLPLTTFCEARQDNADAPYGCFRSPAAPAGAEWPAVLQRGPCLWALVDPGTALSRLLTESYLPELAHGPADSEKPSRFSRALFSAYYAAPEALRQALRLRTYAALRRKLAAYGEAASAYPIDATGWLLVEWIRTLVALLDPAPSVGLSRWPYPYTSAASITHDIEPSTYAYTSGLPSLLDHVDRLGYPATFNLVAEPAARLLSETTRQRLSPYEVGCHGLTHRGDPVRARAELLDAHLQRSRSMVAATTGRNILGYRNPRLDRSAELASALDRGGWDYDSSFPDVDRENTRGFGTGVRLNFPFRPPILDEQGRPRPSLCLELPLTAPDCIQPLFAGESVADLRNTIKRKADYIHATGSLYVALVHAGVFGNRDSRLREAHLAYVHEILTRDSVWLAGMGEIAEWWHRRENVCATMEDGHVIVRNMGSTEIDGLAVVIEGRSYPLPGLPAGKTHVFERPEAVVANPARGQEQETPR